MSFFEDASLVLIPSAQKLSKIYSVKPTDGTGDLAFTRSNDTATRVGPDGLIEKVRTNLILQSQDFTTSWATNASPTITANTTVAPDGTTTADTIASSGASSGAYQVPTVASGVEYSFSVYVKNITSATNIQIGCDLGPINGFVNFNAVTGAITSAAAGITGSSVTNAGNGWYRVSGTYVSTGTTNTFIVFGQSGMTFAAWGAQFEAGVTTAYIATTTAAVSVGPVANVPRLDYLGSSCPRLLLEPQRVNLALNSESFNSSSYTKVRATITANAITSPDGYTNADKMESTAGATLAVECYQSITTTAQTYTASAFFKQGSGANDLNHLDVYYLGTGTYNASVKINLSTGVLTQTIGTGASVVNYGNGWYRVLVPFTASAGTTAFYFGSDGAHYASGSFVYLYGCQVEAGAYATSYIPTLGAAVTRGADAAIKTGISSLIGQTEGTIFVEFQKASGLDTDNILFSLSDGTSANLAYVSTQGTFEFITSSATQAVKVGISLVSGTNKIAIYYKANDFGVYLNGASIFTDTVGSVGAMSKFTLGCYFNNNLPVGTTISQALLFKTRLTNADLAALTA